MPTNRRQIVWAPNAKQELRDVWRYYARVASPEIADKLLREINEAGRRLADEALMWRARDEVMPGPAICFGSSVHGFLSRQRGQC